MKTHCYLNKFILNAYTLSTITYLNHQIQSQKIDLSSMIQRSRLYLINTIWNLFLDLLHEIPGLCRPSQAVQSGRPYYQTVDY